MTFVRRIKDKFWELVMFRNCQFQIDCRGGFCYANGKKEAWECCAVILILILMLMSADTFRGRKNGFLYNLFTPVQTFGLPQHSRSRSRHFKQPYLFLPSQDGREEKWKEKKTSSLISFIPCTAICVVVVVVYPSPVECSIIRLFPRAPGHEIREDANIA